jgi:hypothetical protein
MTGAISRIGRRAHRLLRQTRRQENVIVCTDRGLRYLPDANLACAKLYALAEDTDWRPTLSRG